MSVPAAATEPTIAERIAPFINARLNPPRDAAGCPLPRTAAVDILGGGAERVDCDIRAVTRKGVERFWWNTVELIAWTDIREIRIRALDANGDTLATRTFAGAA